MSKIEIDYLSDVMEEDKSYYHAEQRCKSVKKIARMNISAQKISTKNAYFATFGNLRQNSVNSLELNQVTLMFA